MQQNIIIVKGVGLTLDKLRLDNQVRLFAADAALRGNVRKAFGEILESGMMRAPMERWPEIAGAVCTVAMDMGFRDFAIENNIGVTSVDEETLDGLAAIARRVCGTAGKLDMVSLLSTTPLTARGELYERPGKLLRIDFSDGKKAFCKSRNALQEKIGFELLKTTGLPSCEFEHHGEWIVMGAAQGRSIFEHFILPGSDTPAREEDTGLFGQLLAISAFDYTFGMLDRNEGGVVYGRGKPMSAVDNEYLLAYYPIPAQGRSILNHRLYLGAGGFDPRLARDDYSMDGHLGHASEYFRLAQENLGSIIELVLNHIAVSGQVDCTIFDVELGPVTIDNINRRIEEGVEGFRETLLSEMAQTRALGMFQCP